MRPRNRALSLLLVATLASFFSPQILSASAADAPVSQVTLVPTIEYEQDGQLSEKLNLPIYSWRASEGKPRAIALTIHGLVLHGKSFDSLARTLAQQGFLVTSTDLHGFGRHVLKDEPDAAGGHPSKDEQLHGKRRIDYDRSAADLVNLAAELKAQHPGLPLFCVGESLGAAMAIRMAAEHPELVDGLVLSAPAIKHQKFLDPYLVANAGLVVAKNPWAQLDLRPFIRSCASDDPRIIHEMEEDRLVRRHLSLYELLKSANAVRKTIKFVPKINPETPVLVVQGSADRCIKANAVVLLLERLRSQDQTVRWFHQRGHILLETSYVRPDTMDAVVGWLRDHMLMYEIASRRQQRQQAMLPSVSSAIDSCQLTPVD